MTDSITIYPESAVPYDRTCIYNRIPLLSHRNVFGIWLRLTFVKQKSGICIATHACDDACIRTPAPLPSFLPMV